MNLQRALDHCGGGEASRRSVEAEYLFTPRASLCGVVDTAFRAHGARLQANLNHDGAHSVAACIFAVCVLDVVKREDGLDWHGNSAVPKPFKELLQVGRKVL
jgi:hypothetical protein